MSTTPLRAIDGGSARQGWESLWDKDVWSHEELPHGDLTNAYRGNVYIHFERLTQPWVREAAKRWARMRLLAGTNPRTMAAYLNDLSDFSTWLEDGRPDVLSPNLLTRAVLEDFLLWVRAESGLSQATQMRRVVAVRGFLEDQAEDGLAGLQRGAKIHGAEVPRPNYRLPKVMDESVFDQWIDPKNLAILTDVQHQTIVLLLAHTGLRVSSVVTLPRDCMQHGPDGHPYIRYLNIKSSREAILPIPPVLADQLVRQEELIRETYPHGSTWLLPSPYGGDRRRRATVSAGTHHLSHSSVRRTVKAYITKANIRTPDGKLALNIHPHLFRHHMATSLVNDDVPLPVIQKILDHGSLEMTGLYAQIHDDTVKRAVMKWQERVNARGERIALAVDGPLEEAAWMKERIAWAKQALPNGYCGLPLVQTCPHPNACLSCDSFLTDGSFRTMHVQHRDETRRLLDNARQKENLRLVDVLERDDAALTRILTALDEVAADQQTELPDLRDFTADTEDAHD